jgi:integration host factor subunit beta
MSDKRGGFCTGVQDRDHGVPANRNRTLTFGRMLCMTRSDLIIAISRKFPQLSIEDAEAATSTILDAMTRSLCRGSRIEIRGFGSFAVYHRPPRTGRNPSTGDKVEIPAKYAPHFKVGKDLKLRVGRQMARATPDERKAA